VAFLQRKEALDVGFVDTTRERVERMPLMVFPNKTEHSANRFFIPGGQINSFVRVALRNLDSGWRALPMPSYDAIF